MTLATPWRKALRDVWQERSRSGLVVLAMAIGIAGFSTVLSSYAILTRELNDGYRASQPASFTLWTDAVDHALLREVASRPGVRIAEARRTLSGRIKTGPLVWRGLQIHVIPDFFALQLSRVTPEQGAWPPGPGEILIERDAIQVAKAKIGDVVTVKTANGTEQSLRVAGSVHDVGQAQARMENAVYGYVTPETLGRLGEEVYLDQVKVLVDGDPFDAAHVKSVAASVEPWLESRGHPVRRRELPTPGAHPHAAIMGLLLLAMSSFGLFALLLSGILVVNLLTALMAAQVRQIGVMKAVGGTRRQVAAVYLVQALALGAAALLVSLPIAFAGSRALCRYMAGFLNFDVATFHVPAWVYGLEVVVGLIVPVLAASRPVWRASALSVREALSEVGVSRGGFGATGFDRALAGVGGLSRPLLLALRNSVRRRARLVATVVTLAAGGVAFVSALSLRVSLVATLDRLFDSMRFDVTLSLREAYPFAQVEPALLEAKGVTKAEGWFTTEASVARSTTDGHAVASSPADRGPHAGGEPGRRASGETFRVVAIPADTAMLRPEVVEGRGLVSGDRNAIVVNSSLADREPALKVGQEVVLEMGHRGLPWRVVGRVREPFSPPGAYVPKGYLDELGGHGDTTNSVRIALERKDPAALAAFRERLDPCLENAGVRLASSSTKGDGRYAFDQHMLMIYVFLLVVAGILAAVGGLGQATTMSLNVLERRRELGVLRALGATPTTVWLIVMAEGVMTGALGFVLAAALSYPVSKGLGSLMAGLMFRTSLDFRFATGGLVVWLAVSLFLGAIASFLPAWHASRRSVREAIGYE